MASKKNKARSARDLEPSQIQEEDQRSRHREGRVHRLQGRRPAQPFMSDRAKIKNRRVAGNTLQQQREVANAVKVAREMALLPYAKRVASTRTGGRAGRDGGRDGGRDREPAWATTSTTPRPTTRRSRAPSRADDVAETEEV